MVALTAAKAVNMPGIPTFLSTLGTVDVTTDPPFPNLNPTTITFHSTTQNLDIVLTGTVTVELNGNFSGTIATVEVDIPTGTFAYKFTGLSLAISGSVFSGGLDSVDVLGELAGVDTLNGSPANDVLFSFGGNDILRGNNGNDTLNGGADKDTLVGGRGRDFLFGGTERDLFDFNSIKESVKGSQRDKILDFKHGTNITGDDIDLRTIDAKTGVGGNQAFKWIGKQGFHDVKGELRYIDKGATCIVQGDVNGDGKTDFEIFVKIGSLTKGDFLL